MELNHQFDCTWEEYVSMRKKKVLQKYGLFCRWIIKSIVNKQFTNQNILVFVVDQYHQDKMSIADIGYVYQAILDRVEICQER